MFLEESSCLFIQYVIEGGINFFDIVNSYFDGSSEEIVGCVLCDFVCCDEVVVVIKVYYQVGDLVEGFFWVQILCFIDDSLCCFGMDYVDLLQIYCWDYIILIEEMFEVLDEVVKVGKVCYIGVLFMYVWQFVQVLVFQQQNGWVCFVIMQDYYNLIYWEEENEMLFLC